MTYATIVADPPWRQKGGPLKGGVAGGFIGTEGTRDLPYPTMSVEEIKALTVPSADDAALYLWTTNAYVPAAYEVAPGPYLELFARRKQSGWHSWGNEVSSDVEVA